MNEQMNIFECLYPTYQITKPIRLIELFAGYGSQALALKYLGAQFEHWKICEWNYKSFQAYKAIHMTDDNTDYSAGLSKNELTEYLTGKGISSNWNEPMSAKQIERMGEDKLREIYNNIIATHNLVDVSSAHADDLEITEQDKYAYMLTYSFPCQDLSLAGRRQGMDRESGTRSSLLYQVERILHECKDRNTMPDVLIMENVVQVHGTDNTENWRGWLTELEKLGYQSYWQDMIATDYGIPQIRNRTFCVSIRGDYAYNFPAPITLKKRLKDILEKEVNERYFLKSKVLQYYIKNSERQKEKGNGFRFEPVCEEDAENAKTIHTAPTTYMHDNFIIVHNRENCIQWYEKGKLEINTRAYKENAIGPTINTCGGGNRQPKVMVQTVDNYLPSGHSSGKILQDDDNYPTLRAEAHGTMPTVKTEEPNLRIRKLTPRECFRLQGVRDDDIDKLDNMSDNIKYHLAGDSICTTVLMALFGQLCGIEWQEKVRCLHGSR